MFAIPVRTYSFRLIKWIETEISGSHGGEYDDHLPDDGGSKHL
jgi:hypothetical protein